METHRYVRTQLSCNPADRYNGIGVAEMPSKMGAPQNYWTNGVITEYWTACANYEPTIRTTQSSTTTTNSYRWTTNNYGANTHHYRGSANTSEMAAGGLQKVHASLVAGGCAGVVSTFCTYPMEYTRVQLQNCHQLGPWQAITKTVKHGGIRALYTGLTLPLAAQMVYKATVFTVNSITENAILDFKTLEQQKLGNIFAKPELTMVDRFWSGAVAGTINAACFVTPVEYVRNQLIAQQTKLLSTSSGRELGANTRSRSGYFRGALCVVRDAYRNQGLLTLWRGTSWSVSRDAIGMGCFFSTMHWVQQQMVPAADEPMRSSFWTTVASGGLAGLAFWLVALPMDTAKTWIQSAPSTEVVSVEQVLRKIYCDQGVKGVVKRLYRGWQAAFVRSVPSAAITLTSYTFMYQYLQELH